MCQRVKEYFACGHYKEYEKKCSHSPLHFSETLVPAQEISNRDIYDICHVQVCYNKSYKGNAKMLTYISSRTQHTPMLNLTAVSRLRTMLISFTMADPLLDCKLLSVFCLSTYRLPVDIKIEPVTDYKF